MTESDWLTCNQPEPMLEHLRGKASGRKLRLFAVSCCRRIWHLLADERSRHAVEVSERYADGAISAEELITAADAAEEAYGPGAWAASYAIDPAFSISGYGEEIIEATAPYGVSAAISCARNAADDAEEPTESAYQCHLIRDICGNPFRPVSIDPSWLSWDDGAVPRRAQVIYETQRFAELIALADKLDEAGCTNDEMLSHCRNPNTHVRGCWVLDLLLGKE